jgi:membrane dipeptidase
MPQTPTHWFDAHLDLAYIALSGRDMLAEDPASAGGEDPPGAISLPSLRSGRFSACLATIFCEPDGKPSSPVSYPSADIESAHAAGRRQLDLYNQWATQGLIRLGPPNTPVNLTGTIHCSILMEGADPIRTPDELTWWHTQGVRVIGMAWARASRYAAGNATPASEDRGLTDLGRALVQGIDNLHIIHDISHLSDRALDDLFSLTSRPVIASHSNVRALIDRDGPDVRQRHLRDDTIREIARRGGMIGVNLFSPFIIAGAKRDRRASLEEWADHVEHICALAGGRSHVGLGSDMDGGFSAHMMPDGINLPADASKLLDALAARKWPPSDLEGFAHANWARFWKTTATS